MGDLAVSPQDNACLVVGLACCFLDSLGVSFLFTRMPLEGGACVRKLLFFIRNQFAGGLSQEDSLECSSQSRWGLREAGPMVFHNVLQRAPGALEVAGRWGALPSLHHLCVFITMRAHPCLLSL